MSGGPDLAALGRRLLDPAAPALEPVPELGKAGIRVLAAARHDVVSAVLCDEDAFSLQHYDELLEQVLPGTRYLVGENDVNRRLRLRQLHAAQAWLDARRAAESSDLPPNLAPGFRKWVAGIAREETATLVSRLAARGEAGESINFVREYAFLLSYRMARRIIGVPATAAMPLAVRILLIARNLMRPGRWMRPRDELGASLRTLLAQQPLFGHVFGTLTVSTGILPRLSRACARPALDAIDQAWDVPATGPEDSLLRALVAVRKDFDEPDDLYREQARNVLFELTGALVLIVGKALSEIAGFASSEEGRLAGIDWTSLVERVADCEADSAARDATINEMLRLVDTSRLVRTVRQDTTWRGISLRAGDRLLLLVGAASHDPAAFAEPMRFAPDPSRPYLTSGPMQGPHACYGRGIAWTVIAEALAATAGQMAPAPGAELASFAGLPDDLPFTATRHQP